MAGVKKSERHGMSGTPTYKTWEMMIQRCLNRRDNMLGKAIAIASEAFKDKEDKGGNPYILHCLHVMNEVKHLGEHYMIVGVLHDLIEDTDWTSESLVAEGFPIHVVIAIEVLTHEDYMPYIDYIRGVATNKIATTVKLADLRHNSDITRMKGLRKKDFDRLEKYHKAYMYLSN